MKRIVKFAAAATILVALGLLFSWIILGSGSSGIAFAAVADALDRLRSVTFDMTMEMKNPMGDKEQPPIKITGKGMFLAPSRQRMEMSTANGAMTTDNVMIMDMQTGKCLMLSPKQKFAVTVDGEKMKKEWDKKNGRGPEGMFETVRRLVCEGNTGSGEKVESLGQKEVDGRMAVGFRTHNNASDMTLWADPKTAEMIHVELAMNGADGHGVMNNFRYDVELEPSLFSIEPPADYTVQNVDVTTPVEEELVNTLRLVAEHNDGMFPPAIGMNKEFMQAMQAVMKPEYEKMQPEIAKIQTQYGMESPEAMKAMMPIMQPITQKQLKHHQGIMFYLQLTSKNDSHYIGGGVKLDTPDRPIFWYKPTGAEKYRVIYADLSVKEMSPDEVKNLPTSDAK